LQLDRLKEGKWKNPNPLFKVNEYGLLKVHGLKFMNFYAGASGELKKAEIEMDILLSSKQYNEKTATSETGL
jgi:hypothetical protein